jgi:phosphatidylinositol kinase/protein kinase (PI-3  family)
VGTALIPADKRTCMTKVTGAFRDYTNALNNILDSFQAGPGWNWFSWFQFHPGPARQLSTNLYDIYHCCVYSELTPDDGQTNCPKHVDFHDKINL